MDLSDRIRARYEAAYFGLDYKEELKKVETAGVWSFGIYEITERDVLRAVVGGLRLWRPARGYELRIPTHADEPERVLKGAYVAHSDMFHLIPPEAHKLRILYHVARFMDNAAYSIPYSVVIEKFAKTVAAFIPVGTYDIAQNKARAQWALTIEQPEVREILQQPYLLPRISDKVKKWLL